MAKLMVGSSSLDNIDLVIFDKDGTLMDLYLYWANMVRFRVGLAQEILGFDRSYKKQIMFAMGVDLEKRKIRKEGPVGLKKREIVMQAMADALAQVGFPDKIALCNKIFCETDKYSVKHLPEIIKPAIGACELVRDLHREGCRIALATTDKTERANLALKILGINKEFSVIMGDDLVKQPKPAPDMVDSILVQTKTKKENAIMVGDAITDIQMGKNAGLNYCIGVCTGLADKEQLLKITEYVVDDISNIKVMRIK